jgi:hypothetical protein
MLKTWMAMIQLQQGALHCPQVRSDLILFDFFWFTSDPSSFGLFCPDGDGDGVTTSLFI